MDGSARKLPTTIRIADCLADRASDRIRCGQKTVKLEPKVMELLFYLAARPGEVVTRQELESAVWAGTIVGYDAVTGAIQKLRRAFDDDPREPRYIETISKRGYRLIAPVEAQADDSTPAPSQSPIPAQHLEGRRWNGLKIPVVSLLVLLIAGAALWLSFLVRDRTVSQRAATEPTTLSESAVAILPFANLSGDSEQDYFANGITQDLITLLANAPGLSVVAPYSVFAYKDTTRDLKQIGIELGVRYLLSGSVRRADEHIRVNAELIDATSRQNLWAERYDRRLQDLFAVQDDVTQRIVEALSSELLNPASLPGRDSHVPSVEAYDRFLRGLDHYTRRAQPENETAKSYYREALALDPGFARAYSALAITLLRDAFDGWGGDPDQVFDEANRLIDRAFALDDSLAQAHFAKSQLELFSRNHVAAVEEAEQAIRISPSYADGYGLLAWVLNYSGRPEDALPILMEAKRLNPRFPIIYRLVLGSIHFNREDYPRAVAVFREAIAINPAFQRLRLWLISAYGQMGLHEDAQWELEELRIQRTPPTLSEIERSFPFLDPQHSDRFLTGLKKAGLYE